MKFTQLFRYVLKLVCNMRDHMRQFASGMSIDLVLEYKAAMLNNDRDISMLVVYMQQVEEENKKQVEAEEIQSKRSRHTDKDTSQQQCCRWGKNGPRRNFGVMFSYQLLCLHLYPQASSNISFLIGGGFRALSLRVVWLSHSDHTLPVAFVRSITRGNMYKGVFSATVMVCPTIYFENIPW